MNVLLIGGRADGWRVEVPEGKTFYDVIIQKPVEEVDIFSIDPSQLRYEQERYNLFRLHPATDTAVFAHELLNPGQVMNRLVEGYTWKTK